MQHLSILLLGLIIAISLARLIISLRKRLFDTPDARKIHQKPISRLGGVSFFPTILFTVTFVIGFCGITHCIPIGDITKQWVQMILMCSGLTLLFTIGIADDLIGVRYRQKFIVQLISASLFPLAGLYLNDFYGLFGIHALPFIIGAPFTIILVVFITNAINLIDGIDGLASGLSIVALSVFGVLAILNEIWLLALLAFTTIGVLLPFFYYNVFGNADRGRKIFMGEYLLASCPINYVQFSTKEFLR